MSTRYIKSKLVTDDDIAAMEQALEDIKDQENELALAEQAGIDVAAAKATLATSKQQATTFLAVYKRKK